MTYVPHSGALGQAAAAEAIVPTVNPECQAWADTRYNFEWFRQAQAEARLLREEAPRWAIDVPVTQPVSVRHPDVAGPEAFARYITRSAEFLVRTADLLQRAARSINMPAFWLIRRDVDRALIRGGASSAAVAVAPPAAGLEALNVNDLPFSVHIGTSWPRYTKVRWSEGAHLGGATHLYLSTGLLHGKKGDSGKYSGSAIPKSFLSLGPVRGFVRLWATVTGVQRSPIAVTDRRSPDGMYGPVIVTHAGVFDSPRVAVGEAVRLLEILASANPVTVIVDAFRVFGELIQMWSEHPANKASNRNKMAQVGAGLTAAGAAIASVPTPYTAVVGLAVAAVGTIYGLLPAARGSLCAPYTFPGWLEEHPKLGFLCGPPWPVLEWPPQCSPAEAILAATAAANREAAIKKAQQSGYIGRSPAEVLSAISARERWRKLRGLITSPAGLFVSLGLLAGLTYWLSGGFARNTSRNRRRRRRRGRR
jgi:hypothetical protein